MSSYFVTNQQQQWYRGVGGTDSVAAAERVYDYSSQVSSPGYYSHAVASPGYIRPPSPPHALHSAYTDYSRSSQPPEEPARQPAEVAQPASPRPQTMAKAAEKDGEPERALSNTPEVGESRKRRRSEDDLSAGEKESKRVKTESVAEQEKGEEEGASEEKTEGAGQSTQHQIYPWMRRMHSGSGGE